MPYSFRLPGRRDDLGASRGEQHRLDRRARAAGHGRRRVGSGGAQPLRQENGVAPTPPPVPALDVKAARLAAFDLLARKSWSGRELTRRLRRRGAPAEVAQAVVADLTDRGYVDDQAFARWWAEARARGRRVGSHRLRQELLAKGIPRAMAEAAIDKKALTLLLLYVAQRLVVRPIITA